MGTPFFYDITIERESFDFYSGEFNFYSSPNFIPENRILFTIPFKADAIPEEKPSIKSLLFFPRIYVVFTSGAAQPASIVVVGSSFIQTSSTIIQISLNGSTGIFTLAITSGSRPIPLRPIIINKSITIIGQ